MRRVRDGTSLTTNIIIAWPDQDNSNTIKIPNKDLYQT